MYSLINAIRLTKMSIKLYIFLPSLLLLRLIWSLQFNLFLFPEYTNNLMTGLVVCAPDKVGGRGFETRKGQMAKPQAYLIARCLFLILQ